MTQPPRQVCLYHAGCLDGGVSAWLLWMACGGGVEFVACSPYAPAPNVEGCAVVVLDLQYSCATLTVLAQQAHSVLVIDHHGRDPVQELGVRPENLRTLHDAGKSTAALVWEYCFAGQEPPSLLAQLPRCPGDYGVARTGDSMVYESYLRER